jgi:hypothetical protein
MSAIIQLDRPSSDNFTAIFNAASSEYQGVTGKRLDTHPFAARLGTCDSPEYVLEILQIQAQAPRNFRKHEEQLIKLLDPTVNILHIFSSTLVEGLELVSRLIQSVWLFFYTCFTVILPRENSLYWNRYSSRGKPLPKLLVVNRVISGAQAVRNATASHKTLIHLFERIHFFLQRLKSYTRIQLTEELTELLGKIMAQLLSILAISTKMMADNKLSELTLFESLRHPVVDYASEKFLKRMMGRTNVEDALLQLDSLTGEASLMAAARTSEVTHHVDSNVVSDVDGGVEVTKALTEEVGDNGALLIVEADTRSQDAIPGPSKEKLRTWLSPPDPSINHNTACATQHEGTARWFIQGSTFREWRENGSLLWIRGNRVFIPSLPPFMILS